MNNVIRVEKAPFCTRTMLRATKNNYLSVLYISLYFTVDSFSIGKKIIFQVVTVKIIDAFS